MPSTYTTNLGIEKIGTGEQSGTWGTTTNTNLDLIDQAVNGVVQVTLAAAGTSGSPNSLPINDGTASDGRNKFIEFTDGGDLGATAFVQLTPNDAKKVAFFRNSLTGGRSVILFQGTYNASNDFEIPSGADVVLKFDGAGAGATVTQVFEDLTISAVTLSSGVTASSILNEDNMASDSATALATQQSIKAYVDSQVGTVDTLAEILANGNTSGATNLVIDSGQVLTTNTINETTAASGVTIDSVLLKDDGVNATNLEITNLKANDGTSAGSIANSTGVVTLASSVLTTADINAGTIDDTVIGGTTAAAGTFTTGQFDTSVNVDGTVTADGLTVDGDAEVSSNVPVFDFMQSDGTNQNAQLLLNSNSFFINQLSDDKTSSRYVALFNVGTGDISFYEDTGTTAKLFWDASAESLGIGTSSPAEKLSVAGAIITTGGITGHGANRVSISQEGGGGAFFQSYGADTSTKGAFTFRQASSDFSVNSIPLVIDSSGNVGIGTSSPAAKLDVSNSLGRNARIGGLQISGTSTSADAGNNLISSGSFFNGTNWTATATTAGTCQLGNGIVSFYTDSGLIASNTFTASERMRIDSSGNLLVAKTATNTLGTVGHDFGVSGYVMHTRASSNVMYLNRTTTDGDIAAFYKDGTTVGGIRSRSGVVSTIILDPRSGQGAGLTGAGAGSDTFRRITPTDETGAEIDGKVSLGNESIGFKDLYLSGGVYLGGTAAANHLDDYEEGTWTPSQTSVGAVSSVTTASYIKIGNTVFFTVDVQTATTANGDRFILSVPFTPLAFATVQLFACSTGFNTYGNDLYAEVRGGGGLEFRSNRSGGHLTNANLSDKRITASGSYISA